MEENISINKNHLHYPNNDIYHLFRIVLENYSIEALASKLYLHAGTVKRWEKQKKIPNSYKNELLRILGKAQELVIGRDLDQFYTKKEIAKKCFDIFKETAKRLDINLNNYYFVEPSAGNGVFLNLLPNGRRIGIDILPQNKEIIQKDYLKWQPPKSI